MARHKLPPLAERPIAAVYDCDPDKPEEERLVHRPFNDEEMVDYLERHAAAERLAKEPVVHPLVAQVAGLSDEDKAALKEALA